MIINLLVPKDDLCGKVIVFDYNENYQVVSLAVLLRPDKNQKIYLREKYIFSVALVVHNLNANLNAYKKAIRKLAFVLTTMENSIHCIYHKTISAF